MIKYRIAKPEDAKQILDIYTYYIDTTISFEFPYPDLKSYQEYIKEILEHFPYIVAEENDQIIGYCYASEFRKRHAYDCSVETTIYLRKDNLRSGIGTGLYSKLMELLKEQGFAKAYACIVYPYDISVNFHKKFGFSQCGLFENCAYKDGEWLSVIYMEKTVNNVFDDYNYQYPTAFKYLDKEKVERILN